MPCADSGTVPDSLFDVRVLSQLREQASFATELAKQLDTSVQRVWRTLRRLETHGLVSSRPEDGHPRDLQRPLRTYYDLTPRGQEVLQASLHQIGLGTADAR